MGVVGCLIFTGCGKSTSFSRNSHLALNDSNYFETRGLNFFVFSNLYIGHRTKRFFQWSGKMGERL